MTEPGLVTKLNGDFATVRIGRHSACGSCGMCGMSENQRHVDFHVANSLNAKVGDTVLVDVKETNTFRLAAVAYLIPLALGVLAFLAGIWAGFPVWANLLMFLGGCAVAFVIVSAIDRAKKHKWMESPEMVQIIKNDKQQKGENQNEQSLS